jgi:predicted transcriptional regulator
MAMQTLAAAERRAADALTSCDMATITKRTETTVSRVMSRLRRRGILQRQDRSSSLLMVGPGPALAS